MCRETILRYNDPAANFNEARIMFFTPGMIPGFGLAGGFELKLEDKTGGDIKVFEQHADAYAKDCKMPGSL